MMEGGWMEGCNEGWKEGGWRDAMRDGRRGGWRDAMRDGRRVDGGMQ